MMGNRYEKYLYDVLIHFTLGYAAAKVIVSDITLVIFSAFIAVYL